MKRITKKSFKILGKILLFTLKLGLLLSIVGLIAGIIYTSNIVKEAPEINEQMLVNATGGTTTMYDANGNIIYKDYSHKRDYIKIEDAPKLYKDLLLNTENKNFYKEKGVSPEGFLNAFIGFIKKGNNARGGSTIEQQLIKNLVFSSGVKDRNINRKIKEAWLSFQMDNNFSKDKILEWYINLIFLGENSYGANTISNTYYGKPLSEIKGNTPEEISKLAIIAGLGQSPSLYNLYDNPDAVKERRDVILDLAEKNNVLTSEQVINAKNVDITDELKERHWQEKETLDTITEHSAYITSALEQVQELGYDIKTTPLQIHTGLNQSINSDVKSIIDNWAYFDSEEHQIATTVIDPNTGYVLAEYGGRYQEAYGLNRATQRSRSTGSAIKPFLSYGPAIEYFGLGSGYQLDTSNYTYPGTNFVAHNYAGAVYGIRDMTFSLKMSLNTPAIRLLDNVVGSNNAKKFLAGMNMDIKETYGGQDALGLNLSTRDLAGAFSTLANMGNYRKPQYITKLVFNDNSEKEIKFEPTRAMKESTAFTLLKMLEQVPTSTGTARSAILPYQGYAVKTGTVGYANNDGVWRPDDASSDVWAAGTTKNVSMAVWYGYDSPNESGHWNRESDRSQQLILKRLMEYFNTDKDTSDWAKPDTVTQNGSFYTPNDPSTKTSKYSIPKINTIGNADEVNQELDKKGLELGDKGMPNYPIPDKPDEIINWKDKLSTADKEMLNNWNKYKTPSEALKEIEKAYTFEVQNGN